MDNETPRLATNPSEQEPRRGIPIAWVQLGVVFTALFMVPFAKTVDPDFWWHLRTGKLIMQSGVPRRDPFSWTASGDDWVVHEWLSETIIYGVESTVGYSGNVVLFGIATVAALLLMYALGRRLGVGTTPLVLLSVLATVVLIRFVTVRPQIFTWFFVAIFVYTLQRHDEGDNVRLWVLPALMVVWVNLHLGYVYGLAIVAIWLVTRVYERYRTPDVDLRTPFLTAGACLAATLVNPSGPEILWYPLQYTFEGTVDRSLVSEWQRPDFTSPIVAPILATLTVLSLALLSRSRPRPFLLLISIGAIALSFQAIRHVPLAVLLLLPVAGSAAAGRWTAASRTRDSTTTIPLTIAASAISMIAVAALVAAATTASFPGLKPSSSGYPEEGADFLAARGGVVRLFNDYNWGGYLIDRLYPSTRVFIDGRADFYGSDILTDYARIARVAPGWDMLLLTYDVEAAIIPRNSDLAEALRQDPTWEEDFTGRIEAVFSRD